MFHIDTKKDKPDMQYLYKRVLEMMDKGIRIHDIDKYHAEIVNIMDSTERELYELYGINNPRSSNDVIKYIKSLNSLDVYEVCCEDGKWSSKKDSLMKLDELGYPFAKTLMEYRMAKEYDKSINNMKKAISEVDGLIHPSISVGKTNRINYVGPALMNIPKAILWKLVAPRVEGNSLYSIDIKNQEPSIMISLLGIDRFRESLESDKGLYEDLFSKVYAQKTEAYIYVHESAEMRIIPAKEVEGNMPPSYYTPIPPSIDSAYINGEQIKVIEICNTITNIGKQPILPEKVRVQTVNGHIHMVDVEWDEVDTSKLNKRQILNIKGTLKGVDVVCKGVTRKEFKTSWNAMTYGGTIFRLRQVCKNIDCNVLYNYFMNIPEYKKYKSKCKKLADEGVQYTKTVFGTELCANELDKKALKRSLMDLPIQGTGSDIMCLLVKHFDEEVEKRGIKGKMDIYYTRFDEIIVEVDKVWEAEVGQERVKEVLRDILEHQIDDWVPFKVEINKVEHKDIDIISCNDDDIFE